MTLGEIYDFVIANKGDKAFIGMNDHYILSLLQHCLENKILLYTTNKDNKLSGMLLAEKRGEDVIFVGENLAMNMTNLRKFAVIAKKNWPNRRLEWIKNGVPKKHDTRKFYNKLSVI